MWLVIAIAWGALLRWSHVVPVEGLNYRFALHTHSHLALLGWATMGFYVLLSDAFLAAKRKRGIQALFWFLQLTLLAMLVSFPLQGYGAFSIVASTLFVFGTYYFSYCLYQDCHDELRPTRQLVRAAAVFLALSSFGPYVVGFLKAKGLEANPAYSNALYFYLHFLYNGFFVSGLLALVFRRVEKRRLQYLPAFEVPFFLFGVSLSYFLSVLWTGPHPIFYALGAAGGALQLMILGRWLVVLFLAGSATSRPVQVVLWLLLGKMAMQLASAWPEVAAWLFVSKIYTIIGYIHFVVLGVVTPFLFLALFPVPLDGRLGLLGAGFYAVGFLMTEGLLFGAGLWSGLRTSLPYVETLAGCYALLIAGLVLAVCSAWEKRRLSEKAAESWD